MEPHPASRGHCDPLRVAIVDDDELIVEGLRGMMARHRDRVEVVGRVRLTEDVISAAIDLGAEIVLVEVRLHGARGLDLAAQLVAGNPPFHVVIFTWDADERSVSEVLRLGASGYLLKSLSGEELVEHLLRVRRGDVVVDPTVAARIATHAAEAADDQLWPGSELGLTQRESEVLSLLVNGLSNRRIAEELFLGEETVKTHVRSIYRKLGVKHRAQAVATVLRLGLLT